MPTVHPVIMAGGSGTRLWPASTASNPKQFQTLIGDKSLFQETVLRVTGTEGEVSFAPPSVIGGTAFRDLIREQLAEIGIIPARIILEPFGRNTAAVAALAAAIPASEDDLVLLLPSDHFIADPAAFRRAIADAATHTQNGWITTFGISADRPETGYGYLRRGAEISGALAKCDAFVEKPNHATALEYLADGRYAWNAGIFLFPAKLMRQELAALAPKILEKSVASLVAGVTDGAVTELDPVTFDQCDSDSIDYAVMEHTQHAAVFGPLACGWSDIGSWSALAEQDRTDAADHVVSLDTEDCYIRSHDGQLIAAIGVSDLVIVSANGAVLVAPKSRDQEVKKVIEILKSSGRTDKL